MTAWSPTWKVTINSTEYNNVTLANVSITSGRTDFYNNNQPSYAYFEIVNLNLSSITFEIGDSVNLEVSDGTTYRTIFSGNLSDIDLQISKAGSVAVIQSIKLIALGSMQRLLNVYTTGVLSRDYDGNQVYTIMQSSQIGSWSTVPTALTWDTVDAAMDWTEYGPFGEVDRPGLYELTDRASSLDTAYNIISDLATSGLGYLYEDAQGRISYADADHRTTYLQTNGYLSFDAGKAIGTTIASQKRIADIKNDVTITYKNGATTTNTNTNSVELYGRKGVNITTSLHNASDAIAQASYYAISRATPQYLLKSITFPLQNDNLTQTDRTNLLTLIMGIPVEITDLPANMFGGSFAGFIEGFNFTATYNGLNMTLYISPERFSITSDQWQTTLDIYHWNDMNQTVSWNNLSLVY